MAITSLVVKIGVKDEELQKALSTLGTQAKSVDAELTRLGTTPVGREAIKSLETMQKAMKAVTDAQQTLADRAVNAARGLELIGGVTKITGDELNTLSRTVSKGVDAFRALGQDAPPELLKVSKAISAQQESLKGASDSWQSFVKGFNIESAIASPMATAKQAIMAFAETLGATVIAAAAVVTAVIAVGIAMFKLAKDSAEVGGNLDDMADKTGMSVPALSRLQNAAAVAGTSLGTLTDAVFKVEQRMGEGGEKWDSALAKMGLSTEALKAAGPDQLLQTLAAGLAGIQDPAERAATGVALMGRGAKDVIPVLADLNAALLLTNDIEPWTAQQAAEAEKFDMQISSLLVHAKAFATALGRELIPFVSGFVSVVVDAGSALASLWGRVSGITTLLDRMGDSWRTAAAAVDMFRGVAVKLPPITGDAAKGVEKWKTSVTSLALKIPNLTDALRTEESATKALTAQHAEIVKGQTAAGASTAKFAAELVKNTEAAQKVEAGFYGLNTAVGVLDTSELEAVKTHIKLVEEIAKIEGAAHIAVFGFKGMADGLKQVGTQVDLVAPKIDEFVGPQLPAMMLNVHTSLDDLADSFARLAQISGGTFGGIVKDIGELIGAMALGEKAAKQFSQGGISNMASGVVGMVGAMDQATKSTSRWTATMGGAATGATIGGKVFPVVGTWIGAAAGALIGYFRSAGAAERETNKLREAMVQAAGGLGALNEKAAAAGVTLTKLLNAKTVKDYQAALEELNAAINVQAQDVLDLETAIQKYGFSIEELGPAMQKQQLDAQAKTLLNDWRLLVESGIALTTVNAKMASSMNDYLVMARKTGQEVPTAMKPILQSMIDQGLLLDENGVAITDMAQLGVTFSETMTQGFDRVVKKLAELLDKINGTVSGINNIPRDVTVRINYEDNGPPSPRDGDNRAATGGLVTRNGILHMARGGRILPFMPRGTDTVPAMLTPGERVLTVQETKAYDAGGVTMRGGASVNTAGIEARLDLALEDSRRRDRMILKGIRDAVLIGRAG